MSCNQYTGQAYECCVAVKNFNNLIDTFHNELQKVAQDQASWDRWNSDYQDWQIQRGNYSDLNQKYSDLQNETRLWNNCLAWLECRQNRHDDYCVGDVGQGWYHDIGSAQGAGCSPGFGKGGCKRNGDKLSQDFNAIKQPRMPKADPQNSSKVWLGASRPPDPSFNGQSQIVCCSQSFDNLTAKNNINISDISQKCSATMNNTSPPSNSTPAPSNSTPAASNSTPAASTSQTSNSISKNGLTTNDIIIVLIFILVFSLIISLTGSSVIYLGTN